jgi:hypothetical protein
VVGCLFGFHQKYADYSYVFTVTLFLFKQKQAGGV